MRVSDIFDEAAQAVGTPDKKTVYLALTNAIQALSLKGNWDATLGYVDICACDDKCFALPNDVEAPLAVNIGGRPAIFRDSFYEFHLNGPGSGSGCGGILDWSWIDKGGSPVVQNIVEPSKIVAQVYDPADYGAAVRVYGYQKLPDGTEVPVWTSGPSQAVPNRYLTASFVMPVVGGQVSISVNSTDSLYSGLNLVIKNGTGGRLNSFTVVAQTSPTVLLIRNVGGTNQAAGTTFNSDSELRYSTREEGWLVPTTPYAFTSEDAPYFSRVTAITKPETVGFIKVAALDSGRENGTLLAFMLPNETESNYRRIQVAESCQWIRMRYRRVKRPIQSCCDEILTDCKLALISMLTALRKLKENEIDEYVRHREIALEFMRDSEEMLHPSEPNTIAVNMDVSFGDSGNMI